MLRLLKIRLHILLGGHVAVHTMYGWKLLDLPKINSSHKAVSDKEALIIAQQ